MREVASRPPGLKYAVVVLVIAASLVTIWAFLCTT